MSYGLTPYGTTPYGSVVADLFIVSAFAVSDRVVRVQLSKPPQFDLKTKAGDVTNPRTWLITRADTGIAFTVLRIEPAPVETPETWDITVLEKFGSKNVTHVVSSSTLLDAGGSLIDEPDQYNFPGALNSDIATVEAQAGKRRATVKDLENPQFDRGARTGGTLKIKANGDYQLHSGTEMVKKLILRRILSRPGSFWHLPNYGLGIRVKEPLPSGDLVSLQRAIVDECKKEPEVSDVVAKVSQDRNALTLVIYARLKATGQSITLPVDVPFGSVSL